MTGARWKVALRRLTSAQMRWLLVGLLAFSFLCGLFHVSDVDVGYHIRTGEHIMDGNGVPSRRHFSYTVPDEWWPAMQWPPATVYAWVHRQGGLVALTTFKTLLGTLLMFLVWCSARSVVPGNSLRPFWVVTAAVLILRARFFERPDLFTSTLFALTVLLDQRYGSHRRWQWVGLPILMAVWANCHAGYVYGLVLLGAWVAAEWLEFFVPALRAKDEASTNAPRWQNLFVRPLGMVFAMLAALVSVQWINPSGWRALTVPFTQFLSKFWQSVILEYYPPTWENSKLLFIWAATLVVLQLITWRQMRLRFLVPSLALGYFAFSSQRSLSAFVIASAVHMAFMLGKLPRPDLTSWIARLPRLALPLSWVALVALVIVPDRTYKFGIGLYHPYYPAEIFRFMEREVPGQNLFNDMRFGGPMLWKLYPRFKPFVDGRGDAYTEEFWKTVYLPAVQGSERWSEIFDKYQVTGALLSNPKPTQVSRLAQHLFAHPDWALVAFNDETVLFLKRTEANLPLIRRHSFAHLWPGNWNLGGITATNLSMVAPEAARAWEMYPGLYAHAVSARCAMLAGDPAGASELLEYLTRQKDVSAAFWSDYAYCLYAAKKYGRAERALDEMIRRKLAVGFAYYLKHFIAMDHDRLTEARASLAKAIEAEPGNKSYQDAWQRFQSSPPTDPKRRT